MVETPVRAPKALVLILDFFYKVMLSNSYIGFTMFESAGETQAIISVLELPPRESCRIRVNFESLLSEGQ